MSLGTETPPAGWELQAPIGVRFGDVSGLRSVANDPQVCTGCCPGICW